MTDVTEDTPDAQAPRRRSAWRVIAGVLLAIALLGLSVAAGVAIGRATAPGPDFVVTSGPVVEESPAVEQLPVGVPATPETEATPSATPSASELPPALVVPAAADVTAPPVLEPTPDLPDTASIASGYRLVNDGISRAQVAGVLASVFGVTGPPRDTGGSWAVGSPDAASLTVSDDPLVSWSFENQAALAQPAVGPPMAADRAITLAAALLTSIGVDTSSVDWQVDRYSGVTSVTAWQLVADARSQLSWTIHFDPAGEVVRATGFSAGFEEVPGYSVVGAATAVERSGLPGWSAVGPRLITGSGVVPADSPSATATATPLPGPGRPTLTVPLTRVTVAAADLGMAQYWQSDGNLLVLPAYVLTAADGSRWSLLAVGDEYVQFTDQPVPGATTG